MIKLLKKVFGITELERKLEAIMKHQGIELEKQPRYKVKESKELGFKHTK